MTPASFSRAAEAISGAPVRQSPPLHFDGGIGMGHEAHLVAQSQADADRSGVNAKYAGCRSHLFMTSECLRVGKPRKTHRIAYLSSLSSRFRIAQREGEE